MKIRIRQIHTQAAIFLRSQPVTTCVLPSAKLSNPALRSFEQIQAEKRSSELEAERVRETGMFYASMLPPR